MRRFAAVAATALLVLPLLGSTQAGSVTGTRSVMYVGNNWDGTAMWSMRPPTTS